MELPRTASVVMIGGGVVGCSIAYHLARRGQRDVVVLERETVGSGTTSKAAGGIRAQFPTETEVRFSLEAIGVFERFEEEFGVDIGSAWTYARSRRPRPGRSSPRCGSTISSRPCGGRRTAWPARPR
jgi:glycine/D-amino acid oxidase-like deaminating enzyme